MTSQDAILARIISDGIRRVYRAVEAVERSRGVTLDVGIPSALLQVTDIDDLSVNDATTLRISRNNLFMLSDARPSVLDSYGIMVVLIDQMVMASEPCDDPPTLRHRRSVAGR
jgi:hypothetical protein